MAWGPPWLGDPIYKGPLFGWGPHLLWIFLWLGEVHLLGGPNLLVNVSTYKATLPLTCFVRYRIKSSKSISVSIGGPLTWGPGARAPVAHALIRYCVEDPLKGFTLGSTLS